jgi:hypothetical protein
MGIYQILSSLLRHAPCINDGTSEDSQLLTHQTFRGAHMPLILTLGEEYSHLHKQELCLILPMRSSSTHFALLLDAKLYEKELSHNVVTTIGSRVTEKPSAKCRVKTRDQVRWRVQLANE